MLDGILVTLRAWQSTDLEFLSRLRNDVDTQLALMSLPRPNSALQVQEWLERKSTAVDGLFFVVAGKEDGRPLGFVEVREMHPLHGWATIGICLAQQARGRGIGKEAMVLVEGYCQRVFGMRKIQLEVLTLNATAVGLYSSLGYKHVGIRREHFFCDGQFADVAIMEKLLARPG